MRRLYSVALILAIVTATPAVSQAMAVAPVAPPVTPAVSTAETSTGDDTIDTGLDIATRMTVPVMINGQGPFDFVIDTGADRTVISRELADRLGLRTQGEVRLHAMNGQDDVAIVKIDMLEVSTNKRRNVRAAALPMRYLGADGLLGIDSLKGQRIVMDFEAAKMTIGPSSEPEAATPSGSDLIVVTARTRLGQLVMVDADANGEKIWVVVDSGAQTTIANTRLRTLLLKGERKVETKVVGMIDVLGQRSNADFTLVNRIRIGGVALGNAGIAFADAHPFRLFGLDRKPAMLLGVETLRSFRRVSVDFVSRKVKFLLPLPGVSRATGMR